MTDWIQKKKPIDNLAILSVLFIPLIVSAEIAQSVEQRPEKPCVGSSILPLGTQKISILKGAKMKQKAIVFLSLICLFFDTSASYAKLNTDKGVQYLEESQNLLISLAEQVTPSVVSISPLSGIAPPSPHSNPKDKDNEKEEGRPQRPRPPQHQSGSGSGVIIDKKGFIVTNNHVVGESEEVEVTLSDKSKLTGKVIGKDPDTDLAIIKIDSEKEFPFVSLADSKTVKVGQWVMAVGNPFGLDRTVTIGIVSALGRENVNLSRYENFIQTDASINPGNSGGPLFNIRGEVIGINTAIINLAQGIGFAIPANMVQAISQQLIKSGKVTRGWLGVGIQPLTAELAKKFNVKADEGVLINEVFEGEPASKAGIQPGDIILKIERESVGTTNTLARVVAGFAPGQKIEIELIRNGKKQKLTMPLGEKKDGAMTASLPKQPELFLGLTVSNITSEYTEKFKITEGKGVVITNVESGSSAETEGLKEGDLIRMIEGETISNLDDFKNMATKLEKIETILMRISRENRAFFIVLKQKE